MTAFSFPSFSEKPYMKSILGAVLLAVAICVILFSGTTVVTRENIDQRLQQFGAYIAQEAASRGREGKFTYGEITIEGWGYNKYAVVENVNLQFSKKALLDTTRWTFSTARMLVTPDSIVKTGMSFVFPEPVNVIENSQLKTTVTFSSPVKFGYYEGAEGQPRIIAQTLHLPERIDLAPATTADATAEKSGHLTITYDALPVVYVKHQPDLGARESVYEFNNVRVVDDLGTEMTIGSIASNLTEKQGDGDNRVQGKYTLTVSDFVVRDVEKASKAYTFHTDLDYVGEVPLARLADPNLAAGQGNADITVNQLKISSEDFTVKGGGNISLADDDPLPFGAIMIHIENVERFLASELIPAAARGALASALEKATGQAPGSAPEAKLTLKRDKNGIFYVGNTTFETIAASILTHMLQSVVPSTPKLPSPPQEEMPTQSPVLPGDEGEAMPASGGNAEAPPEAIQEVQ